MTTKKYNSFVHQYAHKGRHCIHASNKELWERLSVHTASLPPSCFAWANNRLAPLIGMHFVSFDCCTAIALNTWAHFILCPFYFTPSFKILPKPTIQLWAFSFPRTSLFLFFSVLAWDKWLSCCTFEQREEMTHFLCWRHASVLSTAYDRGCILFSAQDTKEGPIIFKRGFLWTRKLEGKNIVCVTI